MCNKKCCEKKTSIFPWAVLITAGAGLIYLLKNYDIKITPKKTEGSKESLNEEVFVPEYLDIDNIYMTDIPKAVEDIPTETTATETIFEPTGDEEEKESEPEEPSDVFYQKL